VKAIIICNYVVLYIGITVGRNGIPYAVIIIGSYGGLYVANKIDAH
jgi:hypothetical protein